ncbi:MAG: hypothetical protein HKN29_09685 [Rhodothermales bacterium]|nr:hypothetical protein [Rhodothermales bacterium]
MAISSINPTSAGALHQARTDESDDVRGTRKAASQGASSTKERDAVDLQARASETPELTAARAALKSSDGLDDTRRAEIEARIQSGYYSQPDVIEKVADAMAASLQSGKKS